MTIGNRRISSDLLSVFLLVVLCWLFYWRLLTPDLSNQQSLVEGDFSGQFVAFAHYQATRLAQGGVPLWNPYNNGGHPFLADTQSAVFYPPRLLTIAALNLTGGSTPQRMYDALQKEMVAHTLLASLLMYGLLRRLTSGQPYSAVAGLVAGITFAYGGYLTGYPQLQLAVMESGIWLPLALIGVHEATRAEQIGWPWFIVGGLALALSLLAGHPQTSLFFGYVALTYLGWRVLTQRRPWTTFVAGAAIFGLIGAGLAAVQLIPGWEYTRLTARNAINFDAAGNGFPFYDVAQMIFPGIVSLWSPLYFGGVGLALAIVAIWKRVEGAIFWLAVAVVALALSFGHNTIVYDIFYNVIPGFSLFRGQERSAYVIAVAASILAGLGALAILRPGDAIPRGYKLALWGIVGLAFALCATLFVNWLTTPGTDGKQLGLVTFSLFVAVLAAALIGNWRGVGWRPAALLGLIAFELFSFGRTNPNLESKPAAERLLTLPLVQAILADHQGIFRVDGARGLGENYGTLYGVMDIQGISPLRLTSVGRLLKLPAPSAWEALAVRYVPTDRTALETPSTVVATGADAAGPVNLHRLDNPRPFARLVYRTWIEADDNAALGILGDPSYDARNTVILPADPGVALPSQPAADASAEVTNFEPESLNVHTTSSAPAILSVSLVYYPGWQATIDGQPATLLRADTALTALVVPSGDHTVQFTFRPQSFTVGALLSLLTLILGGIGFAVSVRQANPEPAHR
jgi:Bacterial membrane protein YfhO